MPPTLTVRLVLLGGARMLAPRGEVQLHRKAAAVLAYLALEGETTKYRLAGWLWPEVPEVTARNNMRQLLKRLRDSAGEEVVAGGDRVRLADGVSADAAELEACAFAGEHAAVAALGGELLAGLDFDDCPDFATWLDSARAGLVATRLASLAAESERHEAAGNLPAALEAARAAVELDPFSEAGYRRLMRLHFLGGDRGAALATYERCRAVL
ncbi:MAG TPA: BTAD domain-containing putative transcriptional regulator, partial [Deinococcales bacterium]|nr:BTAD domain-containing putative transcriptional regulator [Deinococcales bacterium]